MKGRGRVRVRSGSAAAAAALAIGLFTVLPCAARSELVEPPAEQGGVGLLEVALSPAEITVGDRIEARLTLVWTGPEPASEPRFPVWQESWGKAEVLSAGEVETVVGPGGRRVYRQTLELTAFATGEVRLPAVTIALPLTGETIEITHDRDAGFEVRSVLPAEQQELEPRPAAPPLPPAAEPVFARTAGGLAGLSLLAAWLLARRLRRAAPAAAAPLSPPAEPLPEFLHHLQRLDPAAAEPTHTGLSLILRDFLSRSLDFPAAESTTTEIRRRLGARLLEPEAGGDSAPAPLRRDVVQLLRDCDQVKFARLPVAASVTRGRLRAARDLAYGIDRCLRPPEDVPEENVPEEGAR